MVVAWWILAFLCNGAYLHSDDVHHVEFGECFQSCYMVLQGVMAKAFVDEDVGRHSKLLLHALHHSAYRIKKTQILTINP